MQLRYGTNPQQQPASVTPINPGNSPVEVVGGAPSYINLLDALNGWQLVREARAALGRPAAASFKHVSPAGAAVAGPVDQAAAETFGISGAVGPLASAYVRARDADPKSSYGDVVAVSDPVDQELADLLRGVVCDGIIAPDFAPGVVATLTQKKSGNFLIMRGDTEFVPPETESRDVFGLRLTETRDNLPITIDDATIPGRDDLLLGLIVVRYTQSNSVAYLRDGMAIGIGAGQQSRVDCTRLAGTKADLWWLRRHPAIRDLPFHREVRRQDRINWRLRVLEGDLTADERRRLADAMAGPVPDVPDRTEWLRGLDGVSFVSDGALPFRDNVDVAARHGVRAIAEPGGSVRSDEVAGACREQGIALVRTGLRLFHH